MTGRPMASPVTAMDGEEGEENVVKVGMLLRLYPCEVEKAFWKHYNMAMHDRFAYVFEISSTFTPVVLEMNRACPSWCLNVRIAFAIKAALFIYNRGHSFGFIRFLWVAQHILVQLQGIYCFASAVAPWYREQQDKPGDEPSAMLLAQLVIFISGLAGPIVNGFLLFLPFHLSLLHHLVMSAEALYMTHDGTVQLLTSPKWTPYLDSMVGWLETWAGRLNVLLPAADLSSHATPESKATAVHAFLQIVFGCMLPCYVIWMWELQSKIRYLRSRGVCYQSALGDAVTGGSSYLVTAPVHFVLLALTALLAWQVLRAIML